MSPFTSGDSRSFSKTLVITGTGYKAEDAGGGKAFVITSYSIHYTKLYDAKTKRIAELMQRFEVGSVLIVDVDNRRNNFV